MSVLLPRSPHLYTGPAGGGGPLPAYPGHLLRPGVARTLVCGPL